jgi:hypothetical protein
MQQRDFNVVLPITACALIVRPAPAHQKQSALNCLI